MKNKLAIFGGTKIRKTKMPSRFAFGKNEEAYLNKAIKYYRKKAKILHIKENLKTFFVISLTLLWERKDILTL